MPDDNWCFDFFFTDVNYIVIVLLLTDGLHCCLITDYFWRNKLETIDFVLSDIIFISLNVMLNNILNRIYSFSFSFTNSSSLEEQSSAEAEFEQLSNKVTKFSSCPSDLFISMIYGHQLQVHVLLLIKPAGVKLDSYTTHNNDPSLFLKTMDDRQIRRPYGYFPSIIFLPVCQVKHIDFY